MAWPVIHGKCKTRVYQAWVDMVRRCTNPSRAGYVHYGARGISVCFEWRTFENFYADMGDPPEGMSLERNDVNGNYEKANCRWATTAEQNRNKTTTRFIVIDGKRLDIASAARLLGMRRDTLKSRLDKGWPDERAAKTPVRKTVPFSDWRRKCV